MIISLHPATADDEAFLFELYKSTRADELALWGWDAAQQEFFVRMQFQAQKQHYAAYYPHAEHLIILREQQPVGRLMYTSEAQALYLVDIALLPAARNAGIGSGLIRQLQAEAEQQRVSVTLNVLRGNRAEGLYSRLGFTPTGGDEVYMAMEWQPS